MNDLNVVVIIGRVVKDVELKTISNGTPLCSFDIANTGHTKGDKEPTNYFHIVAWGKTAENCSKYLFKGKPVCVEGTLVYEAWKNAQGENRNRIYINTNVVRFLSDGINKIEKKDDIPNLEPVTAESYTKSLFIETPDDEEEVSF